MKILLIGGAGLLGSHLAPQLANQGHRIEVCDLFTGSILYRTSKEHTIHSVDATKFSEMSYLLSKVNPDVIVLGVGYHPTKGTRYSQFEDCRTHLDSANVLASLLSKSVKKVVFLSGSDIYGLPDTPRPLSEDRAIDKATNMRGFSEHCAEGMLSHKCSDLNIPFVACRIFDMYGPRIMFTPYRDRVNFLIDSFIKSEQVGLVGATKKRDFIHVSDAASAVAGILKADFSGTVNVGTGVGTTLSALCKEIGKHVPIVNKPVIIPDDQVRAFSSIADINTLKTILPKWAPTVDLFSYLPELVEFRRQEDIYYSSGNSKKIIEDQRRT
jgi:nucleoside-diphosphate-sugar epimerase